MAAATAPEPPRSATGADRSGQALVAASDALAAAGVDTPRLDAEVLLGAATGLDRARIAADPQAEISGAGARAFGEMVRRRLRREPVAYIVGRKPFRRLELRADARALIPRPETELLVDVALDLRPRSVLDVGTGSGALALALADELPDARVTATDTSAQALELARENAGETGLADRVEFRLGSIPADQEFDLVVANLPYVAETEWRQLAPEITRYEPREALLAGQDGLQAFRAVIPAVRAPALALEIGAGQASGVTELLEQAGFARVEVRRDLAGHDRVLVGRR